MEVVELLISPKIAPEEEAQTIGSIFQAHGLLSIYSNTSSQPTVPSSVPKFQTSVSRCWCGEGRARWYIDILSQGNNRVDQASTHAVLSQHDTL